MAWEAQAAACLSAYTKRTGAAPIWLARGWTPSHPGRGRRTGI